MGKKQGKKKKNKGKKNNKASERVKNRPPRLYHDKKQNKYYILRSGKRVYITGDNMTHQQIVNVIIDNFRTKKKGQKKKGKLAGIPLLTDRGGAYSGKEGKNKWTFNEARYFAKVYADNLGKVANAQHLGIEAPKHKDEPKRKDEPKPKSEQIPYPQVDYDEIEKIIEHAVQNALKNSKAKTKKIKFFNADKPIQTAFVTEVEEDDPGLLEKFLNNDESLPFKIQKEKVKMHLDEVQQLAKDGNVVLENGVEVDVSEAVKENLNNFIEKVRSKATQIKSEEYTFNGRKYKSGRNLDALVAQRFAGSPKLQELRSKYKTNVIPKGVSLNLLKELDKIEKENSQKKAPKVAHGPITYPLFGKSEKPAVIREWANNLKIDITGKTMKEAVQLIENYVNQNPDVFFTPKIKQEPKLPDSMKSTPRRNISFLIGDKISSSPSGEKDSTFSSMTPHTLKDGEEDDEEDDEEDEGDDEPQPQSSAGNPNAKGKGLYDYQLEDMMKKYPRFTGVYSLDQLSKIPVQKRFGIIVNLDESNKPGSHWVALYVDSVDDKSIEYYDSFAREPPKRLLKDLKKLVERINPHYYLKLKVNKIKQQKADTSDCGYFSMKFLIDRFNGKPFREASGFSEVRKSEKQIKKFKKQFGRGYL